MLDKLNDQLMQVKTSVRSKRKLEAMLQQAKQTVEGEEAMCSVYGNKLKREKSDVDKLEGLTLTALLSTVFMTKDERLKRERQEFIEAKLKLEQAELSLRDAHEKLDRLRDELVPFANADVNYLSLIEEKETLLSNTDDDRAGELLAMTEQLADMIADRKELQEAIQAGESALRSLQDVHSEVGSAAGWGTWDLLGGGMIATMAKHSKIDSAKQKAQHAQLHLRQFQEELADAEIHLKLALEIDGFSKFADYFFDGFIADWIVQSKIQNASSICSSTISSVRMAIQECERRLKEISQEVEKLNSSRLEFIERA